MNAAEILEWLGIEKGSAEASSIEAVWEAWPEEAECIFVEPNSAYEAAGLRVGNNYTMLAAMREIGCNA